MPSDAEGGTNGRVLIVEETADRAKLPAAQLAILFDQRVRSFLNANCAVGEFGVREWRVWDTNVATDAEGKLWQDAMRRERKSLPWIVISNGQAGFEGPLPENAEKTLELIKKYAGGA